MNWATIAPGTRLYKGKNLFRWEVSPGLGEKHKRIRICDIFSDNFNRASLRNLCYPSPQYERPPICRATVDG
jgi:hypothetical protein